MNLSQRHHYIPQFLVRNFTDKDGLLHVYNKREKRIVSQRQSPRSVFYEWNRNTVDFSGITLDNLEQLYSALDGKIAPDLNNVLLNKSISPEELTSIIILASLLKWRTPVNDDAFNIIKENTSLNDLAVNITVKDKTDAIDPAAIKDIENSDIFKETKRVMLSFLPLLESESLLDLYNNSFINTNESFAAIIGDSPIIEKSNSNFRKLENFIFPLSSSDTFIYNHGKEKRVTNIMFFIQRDLAVLHLSEKYIACKDRAHLENIVTIYEQIQRDNKTELITKYLFNYIG